MLKGRITKHALFAIVLLPCGAALAQMDATFTYQGYLEQSGEPVTGSYSCTFALYDAEIDGNYSRAGRRHGHIRRGLFHRPA